MWKGESRKNSREELHNEMDLNTDSGFNEVGKCRLSNKALDTHKIVTRGRNPKVGTRKVRSWYGPGTKEVWRLYRYDKGSENWDNSD